MIPDIGMMVGAYIFTRMIGVLAGAGRDRCVCGRGGVLRVYHDGHHCGGRLRLGHARCVDTTDSMSKEEVSR